jgi:hypothetical protein
MKQFYKLFSIFLILLIFSSYSSAQISVDIKPLSNFYTLNVNIPTEEMPAVNVSALLKEDEFEAQFKDIPPRFGNGIDVNFGYPISGKIQILPDGSKIWRMGIKSNGAIAINLIFNKFYMPKGTTLFVYNKDKSSILGAFTDLNNNQERVFSTAPVPGEEIILEYNSPGYIIEQPEINVSRVIHVYKNIFNFLKLKGYGQSGTCNRNVICPEGDPYRDQIRGAVMMLTSGGTRFCSGSLLNNTRNDGTPFVLTANHCWDASSNTWIVMFNYQAPTCPNPGGDGPTNMTISGTTLCARNSPSDFCLVRLSSKPPAGWNVYYEGWNRSNVPATGGFCVHFPASDVKKISFSTTAYTPTSYNNPSVPGDSSHWHVVWSSIPSTGLTPITEPGSSGSPVFDQNKRVVGQLHGGPSSCTATDKSDYYGKFDRSWTGGGTSSTRLKDWLDSANTGVTFINGYDPNSGPLNAFNLQTPAAGTVITSIAGSSTPITFSWDTSTASASYKWIFGTSLPTRLLTIPNTTKDLTMTLGQLDVYLAGLGLAQGDSINGSWDVWAFRNNPPNYDSLKAVNGPRTIKFKRLKPTLAAFNLITPATGTRIETQPGVTTPVNFVWNKSVSGATYKWFYASPNFSSQSNIKFRFPSNNGGGDTSYSNTIGGLDALLQGLGLNQGDSSVGQWRVYAYSGSDSMASSQTWNVTFKRLVITSVIIGTGTISCNFPYATYWMDARTDILYTATELTAAGATAGNILKVGFNVITADPAPMNGFNVKIQHTTQTSLTGFTTTGWTICYNGVYTVPGTGWQDITLTTPFAWNGTSNLLIEVCYNNSAYTQYSPVNASTAANMYWGRYGDLSTGDGCATTSWSSTTAPTGRPNTKLTFGALTGITGNQGIIPATYSLSQNYPNPFNPTTRINFAIPKQSYVTIKIFDVTGREIQSLVNDMKLPGNYMVDFDGSNLASGIYFYKLQAEGFVDTKKMVLIK